MELCLHHHIDEIEPSQWDRLAETDAMASHGWLRTVEECSLARLQPRYVAIREEGVLVAAAIASIVPRTDALETVDHMIYGRLTPVFRSVGMTQHPTLTCGPPHSFGTHLLFEPEATSERRRKLAELLVDSLQDTAHHERISLAFLQVLDQEIELVDELQRRRFLHAHHVPISTLDIEWASFDDYLTHLNTVSRDARKDIRRQVNQNRKRGTEIRLLEDPRPHQERLHSILDHNSTRHNRRPFGFKPELFSRLKDNLGDDAAIYISEKDLEITGVAIVFQRNGYANLPLVGVDHELAGNDFTYFNLAHFRPIADAIESGTRRMNFGRALYRLKARRGCRVSPLSLWIKPSSRIGGLVLAPWLAALSRWIRRKLPDSVRTQIEAS